MDKNIGTYGNIEASLSDNNPTILSFPNAERRTVVLYSVVFTLAMPIVLYKHLDYFSHLTSLSRKKNNKEEVPLKKRIAYMVDVCFSVYPYAKLLALLFATILLIGFGGLALYAVNKNSFAEALWLSWTFVADSGNHADTEGIGPRIVSVSISSGGMLIFAMMLGLVSDAISEKVDSLRKGKSEVIERNHILILGWSDKLVSLRHSCPDQSAEEDHYGDLNLSAALFFCICFLFFFSFLYPILFHNDDKKKQNNKKN